LAEVEKSNFEICAPGATIETKSGQMRCRVHIDNFFQVGLELACQQHFFLGKKAW
jgi:hypothetical protein